MSSTWQNEKALIIRHKTTFTKVKKCNKTGQDTASMTSCNEKIQFQEIKLFTINQILFFISSHSTYHMYLICVTLYLSITYTVMSTSCGSLQQLTVIPPLMVDWKLSLRSHTPTVTLDKLLSREAEAGKQQPEHAYIGLVSWEREERKTS